MAEFWIDPGDTEDPSEWARVEARDVAEAAASYLRKHAEAEGWSDRVDVTVRDERGVVSKVSLSWRPEIVVNVLSVRRVCDG